MSKHLKGWGIDAFLVDDDKTLPVLLCANLSLQLNDLFDLLVSELSL